MPKLDPSLISRSWKLTQAVEVTLLGSVLGVHSDALSYNLFIVLHFMTLYSLLYHLYSLSSFAKSLIFGTASTSHHYLTTGSEVGFILTNDLTNNSARAKEWEPHHFFLSLHWWSVSVCQAGLPSLSPLHHLVTVFGERKRRRMIINLLHQSLSADTSSQKPLSTWCLTKLH